eukprot:2620723-Lingulodinium_polyedra.AAC.1
MRGQERRFGLPADCKRRMTEAAPAASRSRTALTIDASGRLSRAGRLPSPSVNPHAQNSGANR